MIDEKKLKEFETEVKLNNQSVSGCPCKSCIYILPLIFDTITGALKVVSAAQNLVVRCNHKPVGWDALEKAVMPFMRRRDNDKARIS